MDIHHLREWAETMDEAMAISLVIIAIAVVALGLTTYLSISCKRALRAKEKAAFENLKVAADVRAAVLERQVAKANERIATLERDAEYARERSVQKGVEGVERMHPSGTSPFDNPLPRSRVPKYLLRNDKDAHEADELRRDAATRVPEPASVPGPTSVSALVPVVPPPRLTEEELVSERATPTPALLPSPIVASLKKYAGTKAAVYVLDEAPDGPAVGSTISRYLNDADWAPMTWTWTGASGIVGVAVVIKDGSEPAVDEAALTLLDALRWAGFNAAKGNWPADWRRFRGTLEGPQTPGPAEAPIRIVIGSRARRRRVPPSEERTEVQDDAH